jgi:hypothetical protein
MKTGFGNFSVCDIYRDPGPGNLSPKIPENKLAEIMPCAIFLPKMLSEA